MGRGGEEVKRHALLEPGVVGVLLLVEYHTLKIIKKIEILQLYLLYPRVITV